MKYHSKMTLELKQNLSELSWDYLLFLISFFRYFLELPHEFIGIHELGCWDAST